MDWSSPIVKWGGVAAGAAAILGLISVTWGAVEPTFVAGHLPAAGEDQVAQALQAIQQGQTSVNKRLELDERHNRDQDLRLNAVRRKAVLIDLIQLQAELHKSPNNTALRTAIDQDNQDLSDLSDEHRTLLKGK